MSAECAAPARPEQFPLILSPDIPAWNPWPAFTACVPVTREQCEDWVDGECASLGASLEARTKWIVERGLPREPEPPLFVQGRYEPVSGQPAAIEGDDMPTLMPADAIPVLTPEVIATEEARLADQQAAVQADAAAALRRAGATEADLAELALPGDGRDAADDGTETFGTVHPPVIP